MKYLQNINAPLSLYDIYFLRILFFLLFCSSDISKKKKDSTKNHKSQIWANFKGWLLLGWLLLGWLLLGWLLLGWLLLGWLLLGWLLLSIFAGFEQVKKLSSYFADFEQVKKTNSETPVGETGCLCIFSLGHCLMSPALHPGFSDLWRSPPALNSTLTLGFFMVFWMHRHPVF